MQTYNDCFLDNFINKVLPDKKTRSQGQTFEAFSEGVDKDVQIIVNNIVNAIEMTKELQTNFQALIMQTEVMNLLLRNHENKKNLLANFTTMKEYLNNLVSLRDKYNVLNEENDVCSFVIDYGDRVISSLSLNETQENYLLNLIKPLIQIYKKLESRIDEVGTSLDKWVFAVKNAPTHFGTKPEDLTVVNANVLFILNNINSNSNTKSSNIQSKPQVVKADNTLKPSLEEQKVIETDIIQSYDFDWTRYVRMRELAGTKPKMPRISDIKERVTTFNTKGLNKTQLFAVVYLSFLSSYNNLHVDTVCDFSHTDGTPIKMNTVKAISGHDVYKFFVVDDLVKDTDKLLYNLIKTYYYLVQMFVSLNNRKEFTKGYMNMDFKNIEIDMPKVMQKRLKELNDMIGDDTITYNTTYNNDLGDMIQLLGNNIISCLNMQSSVYSTTFFESYNSSVIKDKTVIEPKSSFIETYVQFIKSRPFQLTEKLNEMYNIEFPKLSATNLDESIFNDCLKSDSDKELVIQQLLPEKYHVERLLMQVMLFFVNNFKILFKYSCMQFTSITLIKKHTNDDVLRYIDDLINNVPQNSINTASDIANNEKFFIKALLDGSNTYNPVENESELYVKHLQLRFLNHLKYIKDYCKDDFRHVEEQISKHSHNIISIYTFFCRCIADLFDTKSKSIDIARPVYIKITESPSSPAQEQQTMPRVNTTEKSLDTEIKEVIFTYSKLKSPNTKKYLNSTLTVDDTLDFHLSSQQWFPSDNNENAISYKQDKTILYCQIPSLVNIHEQPDFQTNLRNRFLKNQEHLEARLDILFKRNTNEEGVFSELLAKIKKCDDTLRSLKRIDVYWSYPHWNFNPYDNHRICDLSKVDNVSLLTDTTRGSSNLPTLIYHICRKTNTDYNAFRNSIKIFNQYQPLKKFLSNIHFSSKLQAVVDGILNSLNTSYEEYKTVIKLVESTKDISLTEDKVAYLRICILMKRNVYKSVYDHLKSIQDSGADNMQNYSNPNIFNPKFFREDSDMFSKLCDVLLTDDHKKLEPILSLLITFNMFKEKNLSVQANILLKKEFTMLKNVSIKPPGRAKFPNINVDKEIEELSNERLKTKGMPLPKIIKDNYTYVSDPEYVILQNKTENITKEKKFKLFIKDRGTYNMKINAEGFLDLYESMSGLKYNDIRSYVWSVRNQVCGNELNRKVMEFLIYKSLKIEPKTLNINSKDILNSTYYTDFINKINLSNPLSMLPHHKSLTNSTMMKEFSSYNSQNIKYSFRPSVNPENS